MRSLFLNLVVLERIFWVPLDLGIQSLTTAVFGAFLEGCCAARWTFPGPRPIPARSPPMIDRQRAAEPLCLRTITRGRPMRLP